MVQVGKASVYSGTFTVQSSQHPVKYKTGRHQYSIFVGSFPPTEPRPLSEAEGLKRLGDGVHMFDFVADDTQHSY
jgi:hypothetical protein